jgi:imidazolonepropionase-like amidohydrolase
MLKEEAHMRNSPWRNRLRQIATTVLGCGALFSLAPALAGTIAIVGATLVHPERDTDSAVAARQTIVMVNERIVAVGPVDQTPVPKGATVIDGGGKWVVPGLIDAHVHFFQSGNLYTRPDVAAFPSVPYADEVARNKKRLPETFKVWLASGVTGVVDLGGPYWTFEVRELAEKSPAAPRVAAAGPLISTVARPELDLGDPPIIKVEDRLTAQNLVFKLARFHADYIKFWFINRPEDDIAVQIGLLRETRASAAFNDIPLAVHATELKTAKIALQAGANYLVHSVQDEPIDDEFIALAKRNHAIYCPTLWVRLGYQYALSNHWKPTDAEKRLADPQILAALSGIDKMPEADWPPRVKQRMAEKFEPKPPAVAYANLLRVRDAGITIAMGTDAGNIGTVHGPSIFREMAMMQEAGMTPLEVLRSATVGGARALRREEDAGTLTPGKYADLVILDRDPLADLQNLSHAYRVIKNGVVYDPVALMKSVRQ